MTHSEKVPRSNFPVRPRERGSAHGVSVILVAAFLLGTMTVCVRVAAREMPVPQIVFFRFAGALLVLLVVSGRRQILPERKRIPLHILRGLFGASAISLYFQGIQYAGAGVATLLHCTYPVYTALFATLFLGERFRGRIAFALLLNTAGAAVVLGPGTHFSGAIFHGALLAAAASVLAGGALTSARQLRKGEDALPITVSFMAIGTIVTFPSLLSGLPPFTPVLTAALAATILTSVLGQFLLHQGLGFTTATQGSLAAATTVVSASLLEALFLGTSLTATTLVGGVFLLGAVALAAGSET